MIHLCCDGQPLLIDMLYGILFGPYMQRPNPTQTEGYILKIEQNNIIGTNWNSTITLDQLYLPLIIRNFLNIISKF